MSEEGEIDLGKRFVVRVTPDGQISKEELRDPSNVATVSHDLRRLVGQDLMLAFSFRVKGVLPHREFSLVYDDEYMLNGSLNNPLMSKAMKVWTSLNTTFRGNVLLSADEQVDDDTEITGLTDGEADLLCSALTKIRGDAK